MDYEKVRDRALDRLNTGWTQGAFARDAGGKAMGDEGVLLWDMPLNAEDGACSWCMAGAVSAAIKELYPALGPHGLLEELLFFEGQWGSVNRQYVDGQPDMTFFNDAEERCEDEVLSSLRRMDFSGEVV